MKLLIAPWGDPRGWRRVRYRFDGEIVESSTSLKILQEKINPDKTVIIGLDTLAGRGGDYQEVREDARRIVEEYANKFGLVNYEVLIAPGIGTFPNGSFSGDALDYYYYIIGRISPKLLECRESTLNIHLDLTHGINYATILTYRAVKEISGILSMFKNVEFRAYNADPLSPVAEELSINVVEDSPPTPMPFAERIGQGRPLEPVDLSPEEREELFRSELKSVREVNSSEISAFIGALHNGLPLALFRFYPEREKLKEIISSVLSCYERHIEVRNRGRLEVVRKVRIARDFKVYVFAYVIATLLGDLNLSRREEVALDEIEKLEECLFKFDERFKSRISVDIRTLREDLMGREINYWRNYNEILEGVIKEPNDRNFLAHSGFERNAVEARKEGGRLMLRYREDRIETIAKFCQKGLK